MTKMKKAKIKRIPVPPLSDLSRFTSKVDMSKQGCWEWLGCFSSGGYGVYTLHGKIRRHVLAHRVAWVIANEQEIPEGMLVLHHCDNPKCVRPSHLFLGTHQDNQHDKARKGRGCKGIKNGRCVLSEEVVRTIRRVYIPGKFGATRIARALNVNRNSVDHVIQRQTWSHL